MHYTPTVVCLVLAKQFNLKSLPICVVLTHGEKGFLYAYDGSYKLDYLCRYFTANMCPDLAGKPKIFLIQVG